MLLGVWLGLTEKLWEIVDMKTAICKFITLSLFILYPLLNNANNIIDNETLRIEYIEKGTSFSSIKQYNNAIEYFDKAIKLNSQKSTPYFRKACALFHLKRYEEAINEFDKAFDINKNSKDLKEKREKQNIFILVNKSTALLNLKRYEEAIECCDKGLSLAKGEGLFDLYNNKGVSLFNLGRYEEAIDNYNKVVELKPDHVEANANKLCPLYRLGRYQEVVETADKILELDTKNQKAINAKAQALKKLDKL
jgi:superkiller protein 3